MINGGNAFTMTEDAKCKVLVVENNKTVLKLLCHHLEAEGCTVTTAPDGLAALLQLDNSIPDIVFTDIIMPKVSGDQLCRIIRNDSRLKDLFIAVHSSTSLEDNRNILDLDADIYIAKGPNHGLKEHVHHVLKQYKKGIRRNLATIGGEMLHPREITRELLLARKHSQAIFDNIAEAVLEMDCQGKIIQVNLATEKLLQRETMAILSRKFTSFLEGSEKQGVIDWIENGIKAGVKLFSSSYDDPLIVNNRKILLNLVAIKEYDNYFIIGILQDITSQKNTEEKLARTLDELYAVADTIDYGIVFMDENLKTRIVNQAYRDLWHIPESVTDSRPSLRELIEYIRDTSDLYNCLPSEMDAYIDQRVSEAKRGAISPTEIRRKDGKVLQYQCVVLQDGGRLLTYYDITNLKNTEKKLEEVLEKVSNLANHDPLTELPNLRLAQERLYSALALAKRKGWMAAIMFIDLDGFKEVNDSHGHGIGDKVLKVVADRLQSGLRKSDTVARIGGDEFLVIQNEVPHRFAVANVAEKIVKSVSEPIVIDGMEITIGASIGIAIYPENGEDSRVLMKKADDAMYYTKRIGKNNYTFTPN